MAPCDPRIKHKLNTGECNKDIFLRAKFNLDAFKHHFFFKYEMLCMKLYFKGRFTIFISLYVVFPDDFLISVSIFMFLT